MAACTVHAVYSWLSIRVRTSGWGWHAAQYISVGMFCAGCFWAGYLRPGWHEFGEMAAVAVLGIPIYVTLLHYLLKLKMEV
jgi:hypothetical protein